MTNPDLLLALAIGGIQGFTLKPVLAFIMRLTAPLVAHYVRNADLAVFLSVSLAFIILAATLGLVLIAKAFVINWNGFLAYWIIAFLVSGVLYSLIFDKRNLPETTRRG